MFFEIKAEARSFRGWGQARRRFFVLYGWESGSLNLQQSPSLHQRCLDSKHFHHFFLARPSSPSENSAHRAPSRHNFI